MSLSHFAYSQNKWESDFPIHNPKSLISVSPSNLPPLSLTAASVILTDGELGSPFSLPPSRSQNRTTNPKLSLSHISSSPNENSQNQSNPKLSLLLGNFLTAAFAEYTVASAPSLPLCRLHLTLPPPRFCRLASAAVHLRRGLRGWLKAKFLSLFTTCSWYREIDRDGGVDLDWWWKGFEAAAVNI